MKKRNRESKISRKEVKILVQKKKDKIVKEQSQKAREQYLNWWMGQCRFRRQRLKDVFKKLQVRFYPKETWRI